MVKKIISLSIEEKIYNDYKKLCERKGLILSRQVEMFMEKELKKIKNKSDNG